MHMTAIKTGYFSFEDDSDLFEKIKTIIEKRPTYGYRRVTALLNNELVFLDKKRVNHKRVYQVMKEHHLLL